MKKKCAKCNNFKDYSEFYKNKAAKTGRASWCKVCDTERTRNRVVNREQRQQYGLMTRYKMTKTDYDNLLISQGGGCSMCGLTPEQNGQALAVDHDHSCCPGRISCGECVRGLLCSNHNTMLGMANDDTALLRKAIDYLNHHRMN